MTMTIVAHASVERHPIVIRAVGSLLAYGASDEYVWRRKRFTVFVRRRDERIEGIVPVADCVLISVSVRHGVEDAAFPLGKAHQV